uniref:Uncharacterized protein n=1 Tax=Panagrolaimus sp. PS1159 TaxID=55785 RepID=A0AC35G563_9BILA
MSSTSSSTAIYSLNWSTSNELNPSSKSPQIPTTSPVTKIENNPKCYCRFLWNYELHGLTQFLSVRTWKSKIFWGIVIATCLSIAAFTTTNVVTEYFERQTTTLITFKRVKELLYPTIVVCPKNADALNMTLVRNDILYHLPGLDESSIKNLITFAIGGAGFDNMGTIVETWGSAEISRLSIYFKRWKNSRSYMEFYETLFNQYGYQCSELFDGCFYGSETLQCCKVFKPVFVMLRGRCFQLTNFYQRDPDEVGKLSLYLNQIPSPLIDPRNIED